MVFIGIESLLNEMRRQGGLDSEIDQTLTADYADSTDEMQVPAIFRYLFLCILSDELRGRGRGSGRP
jgi:hypothetical protein